MFGSLAARKELTLKAKNSAGPAMFASRFPAGADLSCLVYKTKTKWKKVLSV